MGAEDPAGAPEAHGLDSRSSQLSSLDPNSIPIFILKSGGGKTRSSDHHIPATRDSIRARLDVDWRVHGQCGDLARSPSSYASVPFTRFGAYPW